GVAPGVDEVRVAEVDRPDAAGAVLRDEGGDAVPAAVAQDPLRMVARDAVVEARLEAAALRVEGAEVEIEDEARVGVARRRRDRLGVGDQRSLDVGPAEDDAELLGPD